MGREAHDARRETDDAPPAARAVVSAGGFEARATRGGSGEGGCESAGASDAWARELGHACCEHRYFDLMGATITERFTHLRIELSERGALRAVQPAFLVREDLLMGAPAWIRRAGEIVRRGAKGALTLNMLMIGNATGEGVLAGSTEEARAWTARALAATLPALGRALGASLVVFKDFAAGHRRVLGAPLRAAGFARLPSMPGCEIELGYKDFAEYLSKVHSRSRRADLRRKFRSAERGEGADEGARGPVTLEVRESLGSEELAREAHVLYQNVYERSTLRFERLTPEFLLRLGEVMPDKARFFLWRIEGRLVAFNLCLVHEERPAEGPAGAREGAPERAPGARVLKDLYIGLDYGVALDRHLYFLSWRDVMEWAMRHGVRTYWTAPLNYAPKLDLKMKLAPLDLYVRHVSNALNPIAKRVIPLFGPTRGEPILRRFENFGDLA
ncbi:MAG: GNAT family N-acetyltransferase [Phycisphaerales bacterium]